MYEPIQQSISNSPKPRVTDYFSQGFNIVFKKPWHFIAAMLMIMGFSFVLGLIPIAGDIIYNLVFQPLLVLGIYIVADKINYLEDISLDNFFKGFRENFLQVVVTTLLIFLVMALPLVLVGYGYYQMLGPENMQEVLNGNSDNLDVETMNVSGTYMLMIFGGILLVLLVGIVYMFAIPMVRFKSLGPWQAMEASRKLVAKHFGHWILFILFILLVNLAGMLMVLIGLLITIPATYAAIYVAFDDLVGAREQDSTEKLMDHLIDPTV